MAREKKKILNDIWDDFASLHSRQQFCVLKGFKILTAIVTQLSPCNFFPLYAIIVVRVASFTGKLLQLVHRDM